MRRTMKRILIALAGLAVAFAPASALAKTGLEGRWKNGAMEIVIAPCGDSLCGRVVRASAKQQAKAQNGSGTRLLGARVIDNIRPAGPRTWRADVFVASRNMNTRGTIEQVASDKLTVHGCLFGLLCKTQHWDRIG
jgi:uncharacterized protein (DUF2147 family)